MEYVIPAAIVVLVVGGFVTFIAFYSTRTGGPGELDRNADDSGDATPGMGADESTALGSSDQLAQEQSDSEPTDHEQHGDGQRTHDAGGLDRDDEPDVAPPRSETLADRSV
jgi:hypothetical protein